MHMLWGGCRIITIIGLFAKEPYQRDCILQKRPIKIMEPTNDRSQPIWLTCTCDMAHSNDWAHLLTRCSTLQHTATHCNTLQHTATQVCWDVRNLLTAAWCVWMRHFTHVTSLFICVKGLIYKYHTVSKSQHICVAVCCSVLQCVAMCCIVLQCLSRLSTLHDAATHCNTLQHTATHRNTLQHTATHRITLHHTATLMRNMTYSQTRWR